ncbi:MAG: efflux RND transporter periplasmic adaptor subunit [Bdellovibrionota bacterium]
MIMRKRFNAHFIFAVLCVMLGSCSRASNPARTGRATIQDIEQRISVTGTLRGKRSTYITPAYSGYVLDLRAKLGDRVKENDPLVRIAQTVDQPLAQIFPIRAPFAGVVTQVLKSNGEYVTTTAASGSGISDSSVLKLDDLSEFWLDSAVPEIDIAKVKTGLESQIRPNALVGGVYEGTVREISLSAKESTDRWDKGKVEFAVLIQLTKPDAKLRPGMSAVADIIAARAEKVLALPHEFVHTRDEEYYVVDLKGAEIPVTTGISNESVVEIKSGLKEGQEVQMIDFSQVTTGGASGKRGRSRR